MCFAIITTLGQWERAIQRQGALSHSACAAIPKLGEQAPSNCSEVTYITHTVSETSLIDLETHLNFHNRTYTVWCKTCSLEQVISAQLVRGKGQLHGVLACVHSNGDAMNLGTDRQASHWKGLKNNKGGIMQ